MPLHGWIDMSEPEVQMKSDANIRPAISIEAWIRHHTTALIAVGLVALATLGTGVAQALYSNALHPSIVSETSSTITMALDQHERHLIFEAH
jgi:hypothetical protein